MDNINLIHSASQRLKDETKACHKCLEEHPLMVKLMSPGLSIDDYAQILWAFLKFYQSFEKQHFNPHAVPVSDLLVADLRTCRRYNLTTPSVDWLPNLAYIVKESSYLGAEYVVKGSCLGGMVISKHLRASGNYPTQFFARSGVAVATDWESFRKKLDRHLQNEGDIEQAISSAKNTFKTFESCFDWALEGW